MNKIPLYQACIFLGAISPDHKDVKLSMADAVRYYPSNKQLRQLLKG